MLKYLVENGVAPEIISNGLKAHQITLKQRVSSFQMEMSFSNDNFKWCFQNKKPIVLKDSHNYIPMAIAKMPAAFGFEDVAGKSHFPYGFLSLKTISYKGPFPDLHYFFPNQKKPEDRQKLIEWHAQNSHKEYDMQGDSEIHLKSQKVTKIHVKFT